MLRELHQKLTSIPNAEALAAVIHEAANSVKDTVPFNGFIFGANDVKFRAGINMYGYGWIEVSGNTIHSLCEQWFSNKQIDASFLESVRKHLDDKESSAKIKAVEIDQSSWTVKITVSYSPE